MPKLYAKKSNRNLLILFCISVILHGCVIEQIKSTVTTFNDGLDINQKKFIILSLDEQRNSLEYQQYARLVSDNLNQKGLIEVYDIKDAEYIIHFIYGVVGQKNITQSLPEYGYIGGETTYHSGTINSANDTSIYSGSSYTPPSYQRIGTQVIKSTVYYKVFGLDIYLNDYRKIYEGKIRIAEKNSDFFPVSKCLISTFFQIFPVAAKSSSYVLYIPSYECF